MEIFIQSNLLIVLASREDMKILLETFLELLERSWEQEEVEKQWTVCKHRVLENYCGRAGKGIISIPLSLMVCAHACACTCVHMHVCIHV